MSVDSTSFLSLPEDVQKLIFSQFNYKTLGSCSVVCTHFEKLAKIDDLWKNLFSQISFPSAQRPKEYLDTYAVVSLDKVVERFQRFADTISLGTKGEFTIVCPLSLDKRAGAIVKMAIVQRDTDEPEKQIQTTCILVKDMYKESLNSLSHSEGSSLDVSGFRYSTTLSYVMRVPITKEILEMRRKIVEIASTRIDQQRIEHGRSHAVDQPLVYRLIRNLFSYIF